MQKVDGATEADYFIIGVIVGVLKLEDGNFSVAVTRTPDSVAYWFESKQTHLNGDSHIVEMLIKNHFDDNIRCCESPTLRSFSLIITKKEVSQ